MTLCGKGQPGSGGRKRVQIFEDRLPTGDNIAPGYIVYFLNIKNLETKYYTEIEDKLYQFNFIASYCFSSINIKDCMESMDSLHLHKVLFTAHQSCKKKKGL